MSGETRITIIGNLTADPEIRTTQGGAELATFTIASTPRQFDRQTNEWKDGDTTFLDCVAWRQTLAIRQGTWKGLRLIAHGVLRQRNFETRAGEKRSKMELEVEAVGVVLNDAAYAAASPPQESWAAATPPASPPPAQAAPAPQGYAPGQAAAQHAAASAAPQPESGAWSSYSDDTPF